jgi:hypothetical protein
VEKFGFDLHVAVHHHRQRVFRHEVLCQFHLGGFDPETRR